MSKFVIDAKRGSLQLNWKELYAYKDLFVILAYRDLKVRYAQTFLGVFWVLLQPVVNLVIFTFLFGKLAKIGTDGIPYPVFALIGMSAWTYFSFMATQAGGAVIGAQDMIKKIYFPRLLVPLSKAVVGLVDFFITLLLLAIVMVFYGYMPNFSTLALLIPFSLLNILLAMGVGIWLSALTIRYRDFQTIALFVTQIGVYVSPVYYPASLAVKQYGMAYYLNPLVSVIQGFRYSITGVAPPPIQAVVYTLILGVVIFITGLLYFTKVERTMADVL